MVSLQRVKHLPSSLVPNDDVLPVARHFSPFIRHPHVGNHEVGQRVCVVEAGVARGGDDVGEL